MIDGGIGQRVGWLDATVGIHDDTAIIPWRDRGERLITAETPEQEGEHR
ncbi:MAG: hypothetical protein RLO52_19870 [Sandaracinaceae bacterium]